MKKPINRALSALLALLMLITGLPLTAALKADAATNVPDGAVAYNGNHYMIFYEKISWAEAKAACQSKGGHLATITSAEENQVIKSMISANNTTYWIGASFDGSKWSWITGESWNYTNWSKDEPAYNDNGTVARIDGDCDVDRMFDKHYIFNKGEWDACVHTDASSHSVPLSGYVCEWSTLDNINNTNATCLTSIECTKFERYTGNQGDSNFSALDKSKTLRDDGNFYGYSNTGVDGKTYSNGFAVWIARWNFGDRISWASATFNLNNKYTSLSGSTTLLISNNTKNFDTTVYFYNGNTLLSSIRLIPDNYNFDFVINLTGVFELTILVKDNAEKAGGTTFGLYNLFLDACGNGHTWTTDSSGNIICSVCGIEQSDYNNAYINQHLNFASSGALDNLERTNGFYNNVWEEERGKRLWAVRLWDSLGDLGEVITFTFDELQIEANYYELFLADLVLAYNEQKAADDFSFILSDQYKKHYDMIKNMLQTTADWQESIEGYTTKELEIENFFLKDYKMSEGTENLLKKMLGESFLKDSQTNQRWTDTFGSLDKLNQISNYVSTGADIVNSFKEAYNAYNIALSFEKIDKEFFAILKSTAENMISTYTEDGNSTYAKYGKWFLKAVNHYESIALNSNANLQAALQLIHETGTLTYNLAIKKVIQNIAYESVSRLLGCSAGSIGLVTFAYSATYTILDKVLPVGNKTTPYYFMTYISPVEETLGDMVHMYGVNLQNNPTIEKAEDYDMAVKMLKCTNSYLYECCYDFSSSDLFHRERNKNVCSSNKQCWESVKCHNINNKTTSTSKSLNVWCPVDVYIYDTDNNLLLSVINEEVARYDTRFSVLNCNGKKSIVYPDDNNYKIKVVARENGEMSYYISELDDYNIKRDIDFYSIDLATGNEYYGDLPKGTQNDNSNYSLSCNGDTISCNYDSMTATECISGHTYEQWTVLSEATCTNYGEKISYCTVCGKENCVDIPKIEHIQSDWITDTPANCVESGTKHVECVLCHAIIDTQLISELGHLDENNDGICDRCGTDITPEQPVQNCSCNCHKSGIQGFFWKILCFFYKLFNVESKRYCSCGAAHW